MARWIGVLIVLLLPAGSAWPEAEAPASPTPALTLEQAIRIALEGNQGLRLKREAVRRAQGLRAEARAMRLPQVEVAASHVRAGPITTVELPGPEDEPMEIELGTPQTTSASASVTQPFDIARLLATGIRMADLNVAASRLDLERAEQEVAFAVKESYFRVLQAQAVRDVAQETVNAVKEQARVARLKFEAGTVPHFDVLRAEVAVADARQRLVTAANGVDLAKAALNNVLGADVTQPVEVEPMPRYSPVEPSLPELLADAERSRLELRAADLRIAITRRAIHLARQGRLPSMALTGSYDWTQETSALGPGNTSWRVVLAASMPIFDGGRTNAKVAQARSDVQSAETGREQLRQGIALEVRQAHLTLQEAQARMEATAKSVEEGREALRLAHARYEAGVGIQVEVTDAIAAMTGARTNHVNAIYDSHVSVARLEQAVGARVAESGEGAGLPVGARGPAGDEEIPQ